MANPLKNHQIWAIGGDCGSLGKFRSNGGYRGGQWRCSGQNTVICGRYVICALQLSLGLLLDLVNHKPVIPYAYMINRLGLFVL